MPYNQPNKNNYFGFMPVQGIGAGAVCNPYPVSSSEATKINIGDVVVLTSIDTAKIAAAGGLTGQCLGVAASVMAAGAGSTAATLRQNSSQLLLVYDNPDTIFFGCDTTSFAIGSTGMFKNYAILATGVTGSTGPNPNLNQSVMALSGASGSSGLAFPFKVIGLHNIDNTFSTAALSAVGSSEVRKWLLQPVNWILQPFAAVNITS